MRHLRFFTALLILQVLIAKPGHACEGTLVPVCGRSIFLAKFAPTTVVLPASGPINVPIGLVPYVTWNADNPNCSKPVSASLTLTLTCTPAGGGTPVVIGPQNVPVPVPTQPGSQALSAPATFVIPAGVLPSGTPIICTVKGTYTVTFSGGSSGSGTISGTGDVDVCLVPASTINPDYPELEVRHLSIKDIQFPVCRNGDQALMHFLVANNDPVNSVDLSLTSMGRQVSGLPDNISEQDAFNNDVYAIASVKPGTDTFPAAFVDTLAPGELVSGDPLQSTDYPLEDTFTLGPGQARIISIAMRSYGMCPFGSCNERNIKVTGTFSDGRPALGCASTVLLLDDVPAKSPLNEFKDDLKVSFRVDGVFSGAYFNDDEESIEHAVSNTPGNIGEGMDPAFSPFPGTLVRGEEFQTPWPSTASESIRTTGNPTWVRWQSLFYAQRVGFTPIFNNVTVRADNPGDLGSENLTNEFPMIGIDDIASSLTLDIEYNISTDEMVIVRDGEEYYRGGVADFPQDAPAGTFQDLGTCRRIVRTADASGTTLHAYPPNLAFNPSPGMLAQIDTIEVFDNQGNPVQATATVTGQGVSVSQGGSGELIVSYNLDGLDYIPSTGQALIEISAAGAMNEPVVVPVAVRVPNPTSVDASAPQNDLPATTRLYANYPNPFNPLTTIRYDLHEPGQVTLNILDVNGRVVRTLVEQRRAAGSYTIVWDGRGDDGKALASGLYVYQLKTRNVVKSAKMLLLK